MHRHTIIGRGGYTALAALVFHLSTGQTALPGASLNVPDKELHQDFNVNPIGADTIGANIYEVMATLTNVAMKENISRFASVGGADRKLDSFETEVSIVDGAEQYAGVRGHHRTYQHVSQIRGLWSFGEIVTMLRTTRDILDASATNQGTANPPGEESADSKIIRFRGASVDHKWFVTVGGRIYWLNFEGTIRISSRTGDIERLTWDSAAGPPGSGIASVFWDVNFTVANVGDIPCTIPTDSIFRVARTGTGRTAEWNLTQYAAIGRYGSTVNVRFGP
jgi:hypothetical protein